MRVLVVEDSRNARTLLDLLLTAMKHWVKAVADPSDAKAFLLLGDMPQAVLVDYYLPHENGGELVRFLRKLPGGKDVPVIMMSADSTLRDKMKGEADDQNLYFLDKPFEPTDLFTMLELFQVKER